MVRRVRTFVLFAAASLLLSGPVAAACPSPTRGLAVPPEAIPQAFEWPEWRNLTSSLTDRLRRTDTSRARLVFLGDSITEAWHTQVFQQFYGHRAALNLGISGDGTQGVLWRLGNGHWPNNLRPLAIVVLIGTNNIGAGARPENVAQGIFQIVARLRQLSPQSHILLLGVLPRGATAQDPSRGAVLAVNRLIASCADGQRISFADPGSMLVDASGNLPEWVAYDRLHLSMVGYALMAAAIEPRLREIMGR